MRLSYPTLTDSHLLISHDNYQQKHLSNITDLVYNLDRVARPLSPPETHLRFPRNLEVPLLFRELQLNCWFTIVSPYFCIRKVLDEDMKPKNSQRTTCLLSLHIHFLNIG